MNIIIDEKDENILVLLIQKDLDFLHKFTISIWASLKAFNITCLLHVISNMSTFSDLFQRVRSQYWRCYLDLHLNNVKAILNIFRFSGFWFVTGDDLLHGLVIETTIEFWVAFLFCCLDCLQLVFHHFSMLQSDFRKLYCC